MNSSKNDKAGNKIQTTKREGNSILGSMVKSLTQAAEQSDTKGKGVQG